MHIFKLLCLTHPTHSPAYSTLPFVPLNLFLSRSPTKVMLLNLLHILLSSSCLSSLYTAGNCLFLETCFFLIFSSAIQSKFFFYISSHASHSPCWLYNGEKSMATMIRKFFRQLDNSREIRHTPNMADIGEVNNNKRRDKDNM